MIFTIGTFALSDKKCRFWEKVLIGTLKSVRYKEVSTKNFPLYEGLLMRLLAWINLFVETVPAKRRYVP